MSKSFWEASLLQNKKPLLRSLYYGWWAYNHALLGTLNLWGESEKFPHIWPGIPWQTCWLRCPGLQKMRTVRLSSRNFTPEKWKKNIYQILLGGVSTPKLHLKGSTNVSASWFWAKYIHIHKKENLTVGAWKGWFKRSVPSPKFHWLPRSHGHQVWLMSSTGQGFGDLAKSAMNKPNMFPEKILRRPSLNGNVAL